MAKRTKKWSAGVTAKSDAMDLAAGTFKQRSPKKIAETVERDAEKSTRRKSTPYRSAMSMLTFYINRAGSNLSESQLAILNRAKEVLREEFGNESASKKSTPRKASASKKTPARKASVKKTPAKKKIAVTKTAGKTAANTSAATPRAKNGRAKRAATKGS